MKNIIKLILVFLILITINDSSYTQSQIEFNLSPVIPIFNLKRNASTSLINGNVHYGYYINEKLIFNPLNDHYLMGSKCDNGTITLAYLEVCNKEFNNESNSRLKRKIRNKENLWFDLTLGEYFPNKGPPIIEKV